MTENTGGGEWRRRVPRDGGGGRVPFRGPDALPLVPADDEPDNGPVEPMVASEEASRKYALTPRESEVLSLFTGGKSTKEISLLLFISEYTVRKHFQGIMTKMEVSNRNALLLKVLQEK